MQAGATNEAAVRTQLINQFAYYQRQELEYDWTDFCSELIHHADGRSVVYDSNCCAVFGVGEDTQHHCGPRMAIYLRTRMLWDNDRTGTNIAANDYNVGYRFFTQDCIDNKLKLKPKWKEVDLEGDDWRLSALMRLLSGVEGDYENIDTSDFSFTRIFTALVGSDAGSAMSMMDSLPKTWRGFPVFVNPTCAGASDDTRACSFVFLWIATHSVMDSIEAMQGMANQPNYLGRAVLSRSHPALIYWRSLSEPRDEWDCDIHGDLCKYDVAHPDDCIDHVTFPAYFAGANTARDIKDSLAHPTALWRTSASGAVVFSESLFGSKATSSTSDLIDGFNLTCSPGTFETEVEEITPTTFVGDTEEEESSPVLAAMGNLADGLGPFALPLAPLVVAYVTMDQVFDNFDSSSVQELLAGIVDTGAKPIAKFLSGFWLQYLART